MQMFHMLRSFRETFPTRAPEWGLASILFLWGVIVGVNTTLFETSSAMGQLGRIMPQETWATAALIAAALRIAMLCVNGMWRRSPHLRAAGAFISCFFWLQISLGLAQADGLVTGLAVYPVLFLLDSYNVIRAARDAGSADRIHSRDSRNGPDA